MEQQTPISQTPPPPQIKDEAVQKPIRAIFSSLIWREGGTNFPSILSKIGRVWLAPPEFFKL